MGSNLIALFAVLKNFRKLEKYKKFEGTQKWKAVLSPKKQFSVDCENSMKN